MRMVKSERGPGGLHVAGGAADSPSAPSRPHLRHAGYTVQGTARQMKDSWTRRRDGPRRTLFGINLNSKGFVIASLLVGTTMSAFLLTARFNLAHPKWSSPPSTIGSQAFQTAFKTPSVDAVSSGSASSSPNSTSDPDYDEDAMWDYEQGWGSGIATNQHWDPLRADGTPLTEIALLSCFTPPGLFDNCTPRSTVREDALKGKRRRVEMDLNKRIGLTYLYLFERRLLPGSSAPVITNITFISGTPQPGDLREGMDGGVWVEVPENLRSGVYPRFPIPLYLHYRLTPQSAVAAARRLSRDAGILEPITGIDVLYGGSEAGPLFGYQRIDTYITGGAEDPNRAVMSTGKGRAGVTLAIRRALNKLPPKPILQFSQSGKFTILQVADLHFSTGPGVCRDLDPSRMEVCRAQGSDNYSLAWLKAAITETRPDLIVFSGDQLNGQDTSYTSSVLSKFSSIVSTGELKTPWAAIYGNHDEEVGESNKRTMEIMSQTPYFVGEAGPEDVDGVGNYVVPIKSDDSSNTTLFNVYFLDSHAYAKSLNPFDKAYDWIKASQMNWFRAESSKIKPIQRPYRPADSASSYSPFTKSRAVKRQGRLSAAVEPDDGSRIGTLPSPSLSSMEELDGTESVDDEGEFKELGMENDGPRVPVKLPAGPTRANPMVAKPNAMAFFHIPLPESFDLPIDIGANRDPLVIGSRFEEKGSPKFNSGFFDLALLAQRELVSTTASPELVDEFWSGESTSITSGRTEVKVVANGHQHISEDCRRVNGVWLCFGGGGSYSGYGKEGFARRMRVYELADYGETVETFKLLDSGKRIDRVTLVGEMALGE